MRQIKEHANALIGAVVLAMLAIALAPSAWAADAGSSAGNSNCGTANGCPNFATTGDVSKDNPTQPMGDKPVAAPARPTGAANARSAGPNCYTDADRCASDPTGGAAKAPPKQ